MIKGSCCCKKVTFTLSENPMFLAVCHCSRCRKLGGFEFFMVKKRSVTLLTGKDSIMQYKPDKPFKYNRCFCKHCGSSLGEILSDDEQFPIAANSLDTDPNIKVWFHEHVAAKPSWQLVHEDVKLFDGDPHQ